MIDDAHPDKDDTIPAKDHSDHKSAEREKHKLDKKLDKALEETFPTSDPVSVTISH